MYTVCIGNTMYSNGGVCVCVLGEKYTKRLSDILSYTTLHFWDFCTLPNWYLGIIICTAVVKGGSTMMGTDFWNNAYQRYKFLEGSRAMLSQKMFWILTLWCPLSRVFWVILNDRTYFLKYWYIPDNNVIIKIKKINLFSIWKSCVKISVSLQSAHYLVYCLVCLAPFFLIFQSINWLPFFCLFSMFPDIVRLT